MVSAFASGRKGTEEAERSMGSKQVGLWAREAGVRVVTPGGVGERARQGDGSWAAACSSPASLSAPGLLCSKPQAPRLEALEGRALAIHV